MRIKCDRVQDFLTNLQSCESVLDGIVYVHRTIVSLTEQPARLATSCAIGLQCSAVIQLHSGAQALLECGVDCGIDRRTADGDLEGSFTYDDLRATLAEYANANNLRLLPGVLDI